MGGTDLGGDGRPAASKGLPPNFRDLDPAPSTIRTAATEPRAPRPACPSSEGPNSPSQVPSAGRRCPRRLRLAALTPSTRLQAAHARRPSGTARRALPRAPGTSPPRAPGRARSATRLRAPHLCRPFPASGLWSSRGTLRAPAIFKGPVPEVPSCASGHLSRSWSTCATEWRDSDVTSLCGCAFEVRNERGLLQQLCDQL